MFLGLFITIGLFTGCTSTTHDSSKLTVAVSIVPEATFVSEVAGDLVNIVTIIPPGYSPENYEPSARMMEDLENADVYFAIGVPTESVTILPHLTTIHTIHLEDVVSETYPDRMFSEDSRDPHIWLSIKRVVLMVETIADELSLLDPANASTYQENSDHFITELENVDSLLQTAFSSVTQNKFIVFHPSYGYFADEYGLDMYSLEEEGKEATPQHLQDLVDMAKELGITTVFYQAEIDSSQVEAFAEEINASMVELDPLSSDYLANILEMANHILEALS